MLTPADMQARRTYIVRLVAGLFLYDNRTCIEGVISGNDDHILYENAGTCKYLCCCHGGLNVLTSIKLSKGKLRTLVWHRQVGFETIR